MLEVLEVLQELQVLEEQTQAALMKYWLSGAAGAKMSFALIRAACHPHHPAAAP